MNHPSYSKQLHDDGGYAFPSHGAMGEVSEQGMALRDYFAAKAMQALLIKAPSPHSLDELFAHVANDSYRVADAMIAAAAQQPDGGRET